MVLQAATLTPEQKKYERRNTCVNQDQLSNALGKCSDGSTHCFAMSHRAMDTTEKDFLPTGKLCKVGSTGVLVLESERVQYENNYCNIDPGSAFCKSRKPTQNTDESAQKTQGVATKQSAKSNSGGEAGVISLMSSSSVVLSCMAMAAAMMS